jgi:hypothetical protein
MLRLPESLAAWGSPGFPAALRRELEAQAGLLPLQQALAGSSAVSGDRIEVMLIATDADASQIRARVGVFFSGIVAGCSCADDPTPVEAQNEYCELEIGIDRLTATACAALADS